MLWAELLRIIGALQEKYILLIGDFNAVRDELERLNCARQDIKTSDFNEFIRKTNMLEVTRANSKFTWYGHSNKASKIDRVFVSQ